MSILTLPAPVVNFDFTATAPAVQGEADDFRPTFDPAYYPTLDEEREAREMFDDSGDEMDDDDPRWDEMAEVSAAMERVCSGTAWL
jgi:hypothetical protein